MLRGERDVYIATLLDWLAAIHCFQYGKFARALLNSPGDAIEILASLKRVGFAPLLQRTAGGLHSSVDILLACLIKNTQTAFGCWINRLERLAARTLDKCPVDKEVMSRGDRHRGSFRGRGVCPTGALRIHAVTIVPGFSATLRLPFFGDRMRILAVDIGGTGIKTLMDGETLEDRRRVLTGPTFTPQAMVEAVHTMRSADEFDVLAIGLPTAIRHGKPEIEPVNLGDGWIDFDYAAAFGKPVRLMNDAAMQAIGSYEGGKMLFLGLGTGLGTALINDYQVDPLELAHMPYKNLKTYEEYVGEANRSHSGGKEWRKEVWQVTDIFYRAVLPDYICLGGGNAKRIAKHPNEIPSYVRLGENSNAFVGGFRVWQDDRYEASVPIKMP